MWRPPLVRINHRQHFKSLDGLRGLAILAVCCFHLYPFSSHDPFSHLARLGWMGVDLFFVLSGFLITGILYDTQHDGHFLRNFYVRRALRLLPIYTVVSIVVLAASVAMGNHLTRWTLPYFVYGSNVIRDLGLPIGITPRLDVSHFWSLAIEEQFYLVWPFLLMWAGSRRRILILCATGFAVAIALRWTATLTPHFFLGTPYLELPMRLDSLLAGGALAILWRTERGSRLLTKGLLYCVFLAGFAGIVGCVVTREGAITGSAFTARYTLSAVVVTSFALIGLALRPGTWPHRIGSISALRFLGRYSYGIYVLHFLMVNEIGRYTSAPIYTLRAHLHCLLWFVGYLVAILGVAMLSYHLFELPFLKLKNRFAYNDEDRQHRVQVDQAVLEPTT